MYKVVGPLIHGPIETEKKAGKILLHYWYRMLNNQYNQSDQYLLNPEPDLVLLMNPDTDPDL
jgi:hypothetical protein